MTQGKDSQYSVTTSENDEVILIEDFDTSLDSHFLNEVAKPYFRSIFADLAMRRQSPKSKDEYCSVIDKVAFFEYVQLPGIINDRFFWIFFRNVQEQIHEVPFVDGMMRVYMSTFEEKLAMTFKMYDFDGDGFLQREDVRLILSHVPFKSDNEEKPQIHEGLYYSTVKGYK